MNCKGCGFPMMPVHSRKNGWRAACARCGAAEAAEPVEGLSVEAAQSAARGWNCYRLQKFDEAMGYLSEAVERSDGLPEYLWAKLLAQYGVRYCETGDGKYTVNFWRRELPEEPMSESADYRRLWQEAADDLEDLESYTSAAEDIDRGFHQIRMTQGDEYDVFISFKDRDDDGPTPERALCDGLYNELRERDLKVFYAPKTLFGKVTTDYEGYIHSALRSAKLLLIVTSSRENVSSPWVASEWRRYQLWNAGEGDRLMTCMVGGMKPTDFPPELSRYQHGLWADLGKVRDLATLKWISLEVEKRCDAVKGRERAKPAPAVEAPKREEAKREEPKPAEPKPAKPKREEPKPAKPKREEPKPAKPECEEPEREEPKALRELEQLEARAEGGDAEAQFALGKRCAEGDGVAQNQTEAVKWYRKAAEQGYAAAQNNLGECYQNGKGVATDSAEAVKWFRLAAEQGHALAQDKLGTCYLFANGVAQDSAEAAKWYHKAAEQGNADAQISLGVSYYNGWGVAQDYAEAVKWYRKAAEQGNVDAQNNLGNCYLRGEGVAKDRAEAEKWFRLAEKQGSLLAKINLSKLKISRWFS